MAKGSSTGGKQDGQHYDVIVAGSGAGGLSAALAAADAGLKVLVLEKEPLIGGTTAYSGGVIWVPSDGGAENDAAAMTYLAANAGNYFDQRRARAYVDRGREALDFLVAKTGLSYETAYFPDYHQDYPGAAQRGRSRMPASFPARKLGRHARKIRPPLKTTTILGGMMIPTKDIPHFLNVGRSMKSFLRVARLVMGYAVDRATLGRPGMLCGGNALVGALLKGLLDRGGEIRTDAPVRSLIVADGRVVGVRTSVEGRATELFADRGVVLACGGIPHDISRRRAIDPASGGRNGQCSLAPAANTGDGVRLGEKAGAATLTKLNHAAAWTPASAMPTSNGAILFPHFRERGKAGYIMVNNRAQRFTNEAMSYMTVGAAMIETNLDQPAIEAWFIGDHETIRREGLGVVPPAPLPLGRYVRSGYLKRAPSLAALAKQIGLDPIALQSTIERYNEGAVRGEDPEFGRGGDMYQRAYGTFGRQPNPCVGPIQKAPFYAMRVSLGDLGTFAGLSTDDRARVLDDDGAPIAGLYAAGNDMASVMGGTYPGAGITLGPAITFGLLAARDMAGSGQGERQ